jgi:hypothetical protein
MIEVMSPDSPQPGQPASASGTDVALLFAPYQPVDRRVAHLDAGEEPPEPLRTSDLLGGPVPDVTPGNSCHDDVGDGQSCQDLGARASSSHSGILSGRIEVALMLQLVQKVLDRIGEALERLMDWWGPGTGK